MVSIEYSLYLLYCIYQSLILPQAQAEYNQMREMVHHYQSKLSQARFFLIGCSSTNGKHLDN